jgi:DNA-binding MarR family transcriptional regulator
MNGIFKNFCIIVIFTLFFYGTIAYIDSYFFKNENKKHIQNEYIEKSYDQENFSADVLKVTPQEKKISQNIIEQERKKIQQKEAVKQKLVAYQKEAQKKISKYIISYFPTEFKDTITPYSENITSILDASYLNMIQYLSVEMYKKLIDVR